MPGALHARSYRQPAVEPDPENAAVLKKNLAERLPNVRSAVCQKTAQSWRDPDQPIDAVVLFHFLYYFNPEARMALYKRLYDNVLHSGGFVFILHPHFTSREPSAYCRVMQRVISSENSEAFITDREVVDAVLSVGFELCYERTYHCHVNVEDIDDVFLSLFYVHQKVVTLESVRQICQGSVWRLQAMAYGWGFSGSRKRNAGKLANNVHNVASQLLS